MATEATKAIEAILMVAQEPVDPHLLAQLLEVSPDRVAELCNELQAAYERDDRGFVLVNVAGGYRFQSHGDMAPYVERFVLEGQTARLSAAALETLAIVAYKQPISRAQVAAVRGVNVDGVMRTLQQRGYIDEVGRDPGPGQATLFGTTTEFLERLGLASLNDLPAIADLFPDASVLEALEKGLRVDPVVEQTDQPDQGDQGDRGETSDQPTERDAQTEEAPLDAEPEPVSDPDSDPTPDPGAHSHHTADFASERAEPGEPELPSWFVDPDPGSTDGDASRDAADPAGADHQDQPAGTDPDAPAPAAHGEVDPGSGEPAADHDDDGS